MFYNSHYKKTNFKYIMSGRVSFIPGYAILMLALFISGCAGVDLSSNETVSIKIGPRGDCHFSILGASAHQDGNELIILGRVRKLLNEDLHKNYNAQVDIIVIASDGHIAAQGPASFLSLGMRSRDKDFAVRFPHLARNGTTASLA